MKISSLWVERMMVRKRVEPKVAGWQGELVAHFVVQEEIQCGQTLYGVHLEER
jgi:hypothetical protein